MCSICHPKKDTLLSSLQRKEVVVSKNRIALHLCRTKTDQLGKGQVIWLGQCLEVEICQLNATLEFLHLRGDGADSFLCHKDRHSQSTSFRRLLPRPCARPGHMVGILGHIPLGLALHLRWLS